MRVKRTFLQHGGWADFSLWSLSNTLLYYQFILQMIYYQQIIHNYTQIIQNSLRIYKFQIK